MRLVAVRAIGQQTSSGDPSLRCTQNDRQRSDKGMLPETQPKGDPVACSAEKASGVLLSVGREARLAIVAQSHDLMAVWEGGLDFDIAKVRRELFHASRFVVLARDRTRVSNRIWVFVEMGTPEPRMF